MLRRHPYAIFAAARQGPPDRWRNTTTASSPDDGNRTILKRYHFLQAFLSIAGLWRPVGMRPITGSPSLHTHRGPLRVSLSLVADLAHNKTLLRPLPPGQTIVPCGNGCGEQRFSTQPERLRIEGCCAGATHAGPELRQPLDATGKS